MSWNQYQKIKIGMTAKKCLGCNESILNINNIMYTGKSFSDPKYREELYICRKCKTNFVIRYNFFNKEGHILPLVFSGDINDPKHNWPDNLTEEQKEVIAEHLKTCSLCREKLQNEMLSDAWLGSVIHEKK